MHLQVKIDQYPVQKGIRDCLLEWMLYLESWDSKGTDSPEKSKLKVVGNEKEGESGRWQMIRICFGPWW
jgi:hypothetical protein